MDLKVGERHWQTKPVPSVSPNLVMFVIHMTDQACSERAGAFKNGPEENRKSTQPAYGILGPDLPRGR